MKLDRDSRFEILRIIAIIMIVFNHYASHGVLMLNKENEYVLWSQGSIINKIYIVLLTPGGRVGVAIFFMLSGYFLINNDKVKNFIPIIIQMYYYSVICSIIALLCYFCGNPAKVYLGGLVMSVIKYICVPFSSSGWWYVTVYVLLIILSPIINKYLGNLPKKQFIIVLLYFWLFAYGLGGAFNSPFYNLSKGLFFYLLGAYINNYFEKNKKDRIIIKILIFVICWICCSYLKYISICRFDSNIHTMIFDFIQNVIFIPLLALLLFIIVCDSDRKTNKVINYIASFSFGIYLFHDSDLIRNIIWTILKVDDQYSSSMCILFSVLTCALIIIVAFILDCVYKALLPFLTKLINHFYVCISDRKSEL